MAPILAMAISAIGNAKMLGSITATRSPFLTPATFCRYAANAVDVRSTSAYVIVWPKARNAGFAAKCCIASSASWLIEA